MILSVENKFLQDVQSSQISAGGLLDSEWMTEKLEFNNTEPVLSGLETDTFNKDLGGVLESTVASEPDNIINIALENASSATTEQPDGNIFAGVDEILKRLCADRKIPFNEKQPSGPSSPLQSVPDVEIYSPATTLSPGSDVSDENMPLACSDGESFSSPSSPDTPVKKSVPVTFHPFVPRPRPTYFAPYPKEKPVKMKSPQQKKRKREQNKDAATRYRVKKRDEQDVVQSELNGLEKDNVELKEQVTSLSKEIEYLKNLMLEVCKTRLQKQSSLTLQIN